VIVQFIAIHAIIAQFDRGIFIALIIFLITYFVLAEVMSRKVSKISQKVSKQGESLNGLFFESVNNIKTVKVMSIAETLYIPLAKKTEELFQTISKRIFWYRSRISLLWYLAYTFKIGMIFFIAHGILVGHYEIGFLILANGYFSNLHQSIDALSDANVDFAVSKVGIARAKEILNEPIKIEDDEGKVSFPIDWKKILIKNLSFAYNDEKSKNKILNNISFEINRGEKVGIIGVSGAGKSTLFKLLLKEREEFEGDILFETEPSEGTERTRTEESEGHRESFSSSVSIKQIKKNSYFQKVSVVLQETEVFNFSLRDNITITNETQVGNEKLLKQSLITAHLTEMIKKLPQGLDTLIGEKGVKLSGGEKQRLGLARAIFKQPEILLLDEATSHLDLESEEKIRDSLHKFFEKEVTAIVIAHRLTTIREMDKILVIEDGKLIEAGNFSELIEKEGRFHQLWEKQRF
jgi:ABC-type multidrug transport system fused ATPase/permease subunit